MLHEAMGRVKGSVLIARYTFCLHGRYTYKDQIDCA